MLATDLSNHEVPYFERVSEDFHLLGWHFREKHLNCNAVSRFVALARRFSAIKMISTRELGFRLLGGVLLYSGLDAMLFLCLLGWEDLAL